jgi:hypothetical protein
MVKWTTVTREIFWIDGVVWPVPPGPTGCRPWSAGAAWIAKQCVVVRLSVAGALLGAQDHLIVEAVFGEVVHLSLLDRDMRHKPPI